MNMIATQSSGVVLLVFAIWYIITVVQGFLAYGTAYRAARANGDNGVSLFGWLFVFGLASIIPGLGFYFWHRSREEY